MNSTIREEEHATILASRHRSAIRRLFGSEKAPDVSHASEGPDARILQRLTFSEGFDQDLYENELATSYYTLRYEYGYAFEYSQLMMMVMRIQQEWPLSVLSIGCGQGLDLWGLRYALTKASCGTDEATWDGIDAREWPTLAIPPDRRATYHFGVDLAAAIGVGPGGRSGADGLPGLPVRMSRHVLILAKVLGELSEEDMRGLEGWLRSVRFEREEHWLCIPHTERATVTGLNGKGLPSVDAERAVRVERAFTAGLERQGYVRDDSWVPEACAEMGMRVRDVACGFGQAPVGCMTYARRRCIGKVDATFYTPSDCWAAMGLLPALGEAICPDFVSAYGRVKAWKGGGGNARRRQQTCANPSCDGSVARGCTCPLYKAARVMTDRMAYQVVRFVRRQA